MSFPIQNFRSSTPGLQPPSLLPGQIFFNTADKVLYTGNGTSYKIAFDGTQTVGVQGEGWFATPLSLQGFSGAFVIDPTVYGDNPLDGQVLTWDAALDRVVWANGGGGSTVTIYQFTNAEMVAAAGTTASEKLNALTGGCSGTGSIAIVTGIPGDVWQGDYFCNGGAWFFGANYAWPTAEQVVYIPSGNLIATNVQTAIDELEVEKVQTPTNTPVAGEVLGWNGTATQWVPNGGGGGGSVNSVTGVAPIVVDNTDPTNPIVTVTYANTTASGVVTLNDTVTSVSNAQAATAGAVKIAYDAATGAQTDANQAIADALAAQSTANTAVANAATAQNTANTALTSAATAQTTANTALADAATADGKAVAAQTTANQAISDAAAASAAAATADGKAVAAQTTANQAITDAASAQASADTKLPLAGGTLTGSLTTQNINVQTGYNLQFNSGVQGSIDAISNSTTFASSTTAASSTAVKSANDLATTANTTANTALAKANSDLVAPTTAANEGDYIRYNGTENTWASIYNVTATVNTFYANEGKTNIQDLVDATSIFGQINVAAGQYNGPALIIDGKETLSITGPDNPTGAVNALIGFTGNRNVVISGATSQRIRLTNLSIYGTLTIDGTQGRHYFKNVTVTGLTSVVNGTSGFVVFENCTFTGGVSISVDFGSTASFINCNFDGTTVVNGASPLQVVYNNCVNFASFPANTTPFGFNALNSGLSAVNASQFLQGGVDIGALAIGALPRATYQSLGDLVVGAAGGVPTRFPVTPNSGYVLTANPAAPFGMVWAAATGGVQSVSGVAPVTVDVTDPANPIISVSAASTTAAGIVQLNDTLSSTAIDQALTAAQGKSLQDQINALVISGGLTLAGTINATTAFVDSVTANGTSAGFVVGSVLPTPSSSVLDYFVIVDVPGTMTPPGGSTPQACDQGDWWYCDGTAWVFLNVGINVPIASTTVPGIVQLATDAEVQTGTNVSNAVVPSALQSKMSDSVSFVSSITIASSAAVKTANDAGQLGITNAATAQTTANTAEANAQTGITNAAAAQSTANTALANAGLAQTDATSALNNAATAQSTANTAEANAQTGITNAAAAQATANAALPKAGGTMTGDITFAPTQTFPGTGTVTSVTGSSPITVDNTNPATPIVGVNLASTVTPGVVQVGSNIDVTSGVISVAQAAPITLGLVYGSTTPSTGAGAYNVSIGYGAGGSLTTGQFNVQIGGASGDITSGSNNVAIGFDCNVTDPAGDRQLAIGPDAYTRWLTGDSSMNIKPGAGLRDGTNSLGTAGQILSSTGTALQWVNNAVDGVQSVTGTAPITVNNTDPANPVVGVNAASITAAGVVQLNDSVTSTSVTEAATANAVKTAYDLAAAALPASIYTTKGDLVAGGTAGAPTRLPVTANDGYVLSADSASSTGLSWNATLAANTIYANVGQVDIQTAINEAVPGQQTQIIMSPGEFLVGTFPTNEVFASGVDKLTILGSPAPKGSYTSAIGTINPPTSYRDFTFDNGSVYFNMRDLAIKGDLTFNNTLLKAYFDNVTVVGRTFFTGTNTNFIFFFNCNFSDNISFTNTFTGQAYFVGCTFNNHTINTTAADPTQVICVNCDGFSTYPTNATLSGYNALDSGSTTVTANNFVTPTGTDIGALAIGALPKAGGTMTGNIVFNTGQTFPGTGTVTSVAGAGAISITGTAADPIVNVAAASTSVAGVVQLSTSLSSTSITEASTPFAVKAVSDAAIAAQATADAALPKATYTTKGDLVVGGTAGAPTRLPVSASNGLALVANSAASLGVEWVENGIFHNTIYANVGTTTLQAAINSAPSASYVVELSPGTFAENVTIDGSSGATKILGPISPTYFASANVNAITITGASTQYVTLTDLKVVGNVEINGTLGVHALTNVQMQNLLISGSSSGSIQIENCKFTGSITIPSTFTGIILFNNCDFTLATTITSNATNSTKVVFTNSLGLPSFTIANATLVGLNGDRSNNSLLSTSAAVAGALTLAAGGVAASVSTVPVVLNGVTGAVTPITNGANGSFTSGGRTITVTNGLITSIV